MNVIARFAMAQEEISAALEAYLDAAVSPPVKRLLWKRLRLSDAERLDAIVALASTVEYPLHKDAYRETYRATMAVRNRLAHGGISLTLNDAATAEPGLFTFGADESENKFYSLSELRAVASDARWLSIVALRLGQLVSGEPVLSPMRHPSDLPLSAVSDPPADRTGWGESPLCPRGHSNVVGVSTRYGDAWLCGHCDHVRVRNDDGLIGRRDVLADAARSPEPGSPD
jgi:hypothetical protein